MALSAHWRGWIWLALANGLVASSLYGDSPMPFGLDCSPAGPGVVQCRWEAATVGATGYAFRITDARGNVFASGSLPYASRASHSFSVPEFPGGTVRVEVQTQVGPRAGEPAIVEREMPRPTCVTEDCLCR